MITRTPSQILAVKSFDQGAKSERVILPQADGCRVKVTRFIAPAGSRWENLVEPVDATMYVMKGVIRVAVAGKTETLSQGAVYHVPTGEARTIDIIEDGTFLCFFSQAGDGAPMPKDD